MKLAIKWSVQLGRFSFGGWLCLLAIFLLNSPVATARVSDRLPYPQELRFKVEFWKAIYTKYNTHQGLIHDAEDLSVIYDAVELPRNGDMSGVDRMRAEIRETIFNILRKHGENLNVEERKILAKFPAGATRSRLLQATENIRFQLGQSDRFKEGIIRSGYYMKYIEKILREEGAPDFLKYLPHVESSFQENAMSKFGAAGLWQLMESTGRQYLRINYAIDERLDPWLATRAAARYLMHDYQRFKSWPLAITAYNHGAGGMINAVNSLGTDDIAEIAFRYTSPSFGFASRNYYGQFLAAVEVASDPEKYFGPLHMEPPLQFDEVKIKQPTSIKEFSQNYRFTMEEFRRLNPALRAPVLANLRMIPAGTLLRLPPHSHRVPTLLAALDRRAPKLPTFAKLPEITPEGQKSIDKKALAASKSKYAIQDLVDGKGWITVEMNETISQIAEWLHTDPNEVRTWNGIDTDGQARVGQRLIVKLKDMGSADFEQVREDYHKKIREDFFVRYEVAKLQDYEVRRGENLWSLCYQKFDIPPWLLQEYNEKANLMSLAPGTKLKIPVLHEKDSNLVSATE